MRIGVDIDGVLNYNDRINLEYGSKFCVETGKGGVKKIDAYSLREAFGWDEETRDEYWYKYGKYQVMICPATLNAAEVIRKLRAEGHEIWIITGRSDNDERLEGMPEGLGWEAMTRNWLAENGIEYDAIYFGRQQTPPTDKGTFCRENEVDIMVEDLPSYLECFDAETKVFIYDHPYNRKVELENAERVYTWYDIYSKVKEMEEA